MKTFVIPTSFIMSNNEEKQNRSKSILESIISVTGVLWVSSFQISVIILWGWVLEKDDTII